ncbi:lysozyme [Gandjariella thermophila]|uniref:Lysozyme n=1 Tax=Gandjariella thermophila TaxID=1931992 RepID=A0A4D4JE08_9PSEU|nr:lysozyme [Gandjariella thermophila]
MTGGALCAAPALLPAGAPAQAEPAPNARPAAPPAGPANPDDDHAGAQIARREGTGRSRGVPPPRVARTQGLDVSSHQGNVDWAAVVAKGAAFAYVKATEGTTYRNPFFAQQYNGSYQAGLIRGAYHFALPNVSDGVAQANFFVDHGGGWSPDGRTLPPALDIEYNPYGPICYGLSQRDMVGWIRAFSDQVHARTGRWPTIYTSTRWWSACTGNLGDFSDTNPLWLARYAADPGPMPFDWDFHTFWQYDDAGAFPGDQDSFNGSLDRLRALALG